MALYKVSQEHLDVDACNAIEYTPHMNKPENASVQIRVFPSDYKYLIEIARKRRTIVAKVINEILQERYAVKSN